MSIKFPLRILAVDPATTKSGWAVLDLHSLHPLRMTVIARAQIDGDKLLRDKKDMLKIYQKQFCVLDALYSEYCNIVAEFKPDVVVSESAFGYTHMSAFLALTLAIHTLQRAARDTLGIAVVLVPPTISKKATTGSGAADKDQMRAAYVSADWLDKGSGSEEISEHEIDAIAHGTGYVRRDLVGDVVQISALEKKRMKREKQRQKENKE